MTLSIILPIYEKPYETLIAVSRSVGLNCDEPIYVFDRTPVALRDRILQERLGPERKILCIDGPAGWRSPCIAANFGLQEVTGDITIYNPSDIVQAPGNCDFIKQQMEIRPAVYFAKVLESKPEICNGPGSAGPVLCSSENPRPLTFLFAAPTAALKAIGGWDEAFQAGVCYEDDDLMARLWNYGLDFIFDDTFHGEHQSHDRSYFRQIDIAKNQQIFLEKHGTMMFWQREVRRERMTLARSPGRTEWRHAKSPASTSSTK